MELFSKCDIKFGGKGFYVWEQEIYFDDLVERDYAYIHAFTFTPEGRVILAKHTDGHYSTLGGGVEKGESLEEALRREMLEEGNAKLLRWGRVFMIKHTKKDDPSRSQWQLAVWADAELLPGEVPNDPDHDVENREIVSVDEVVGKLNWPGKVAEQLRITLEERAKTR